MSKTNEFEKSIKELKGTVESIKKGMEELKKNGLNEDIIIYSLQRSSQKHNPSYTPIKVGQIKALLRGVEDLKEFMFPEQT